MPFCLFWKRAFLNPSRHQPGPGLLKTHDPWVALVPMPPPNSLWHPTSIIHATQGFCRFLNVSRKREGNVFFRTMRNHCQSKWQRLCRLVWRWCCRPCTNTPCTQPYYEACMSSLHARPVSTLHCFSTMYVMYYPHKSQFFWLPIYTHQICIDYRW